MGGDHCRVYSSGRPFGACPDALANGKPDTSWLGGGLRTRRRYAPTPPMRGKTSPRSAFKLPLRHAERGHLVPHRPPGLVGLAPPSSTIATRASCPTTGVALVAVTPITKRKPEGSGLLARLAGPPPASRKPVCHTGRLLRELPDAERDALVGALANDGWTATAIARELVAEGHDIQAQSLARHRKGDCKCHR